MANLFDWFFEQLVTSAEMDEAFGNLEIADQQFVSDQDYFGVYNGLGVTQQTVPDLTVQVAVGTAYDQSGQRVRIPSIQNLDLSVDSNSSSTAVVGPGNSKWVSVFVRFTRSLSDQRFDGNGSPVFFRRDESFEFVVTQGAEAVTPSRPALQSDAILIADVLLSFGTTQITDALIESEDVATDPTSRFQFAFNLTGSSPAEIRVGPLPDAMQAILTELNNHIAQVGAAHDLDAITWDGTTARDSIGALDGLADAQLAADTMAAQIARAAGLGYSFDEANIQKGVVSGLRVSFNATLTVDVSAGMALLDGPQFVDLASPTSIDLTSFVDGGNPRWVVIEMDETNGAATFGVVAGTAAATPALPTTSTGQIPLAYVYLPAAAGSIAQTDIVECRPILDRHAQPELSTQEPGQFLGGGSQWSTGSVFMQGSAMRFPGESLWRRSMKEGFNGFDIDSSTEWLKTGYSFTDGPIYIYICKPPFPAASYTNLAPRELVSSGTRIPSMAPDGENDMLQNCIIMVCGDSPSLSGTTSLSNMQGPAGSAGAPYSVQDPTWGTHTIPQEDTAYHSLGMYSTNIVSTVMKGSMQLINDDDLIDETQSSTGSLNSGTGALGQANPLSASGTLFIPSSFVASWLVRLEYTAPAGDDIRARFEWGGGDNSVDNHIHYHEDTPAVGAEPQIEYKEIWTRTDDAFDWDVLNIAGSGSADLRLSVVGFRDEFVERRGAA